MNYRIIWRQAALNHLARIWTDENDREAVQQAADEIDRRLARDPYGESEPRGRWRTTYLSPLVVFFRVDEADRTVHVLSVRYFRGPSPEANGAEE